MTILGVGTDILSKKRTEKTYQKFGDRFLKKICTPLEFQEYSKSAKLLDRAAKSFAAKEAFSKALGTGIGKNFKFHDISVVRDASGKPFFVFHKDVNFKAHLSFSDEGDMILAFVVIEQI